MRFDRSIPRRMVRLITLFVLAVLLLRSAQAHGAGCESQVVSAASGAIGQEETFTPLPLNPLAGTTWAKSYAAANNVDTAVNSIAATADGGYIMAGSTSGSVGRDGLVVKLDSAGNIQWQKALGGTDTDDFNSIVVSNTSSPETYAIAGSTRSFSSGGDDAWVVKLDANGNILWQKTFGVQVVGTTSLEDFANRILATGDGGYIVVGRTNSAGSGDYDAWVFKLESSGALVWSAVYGDAYFEEASDVAVSNESGLDYYIVTGTRVPVTPREAYVLKLDAGGGVVWQRGVALTGVDLLGLSVVPASSGSGYAIAGNVIQGASSRGWVLKLNTDGSQAWFKDYGVPLQASFNSITRTPEGGFALGGSTNSGSTAPWSWFVKLDGVGGVLAQKTYATGFAHVAYSIVPTADAGYALAGARIGASAQSTWALKVDGSGGVGSCPPVAQATDTTTGDVLGTISAGAFNSSSPATLLGTSSATIASPNLQSDYSTTLCDLFLPLTVKP